MTRPEMTRPEITRPEKIRPEKIRPEKVRPEKIRPEKVRAGPARPDDGTRMTDRMPAEMSTMSAGTMSRRNTSVGKRSRGTASGGTASGGGAATGGWPTRFLAVLRETGNVSAAARQAGTSRSVCYRHRRRHAGFAAAWEDAVEEAADRLEMEAFRRAVDGVEEERFFGGQVIGEVTRYSDSLLMFLLRARRPAIYGPRPETDAVKSAADETENDEQFLARLRCRMAALAEDGGPGGD